MNPKNIEEMLDDIRKSFQETTKTLAPHTGQIERAMEDIENRMRYLQEFALDARQARIDYINFYGRPKPPVAELKPARYRPNQPPVDPIPPSQRAPVHPKPDPIEDARRAERIKKQEEEQADKERRSKIPGGFDIWDD